MSLAFDIKDRLVAEGVGTYSSSGTTPSTIRIGAKAVVPPANQPGPFIHLIESGGGGFDRTHNRSSTALPTCSVSVRGASYDASWAKMEEVVEALGGADGLHNIVLGTTYYLHLVPRQNITDIGLDAASRQQFGINYEAEQKYSDVPLPPSWIQQGWTQP